MERRVLSLAAAAVALSLLTPGAVFAGAGRVEIDWVVVGVPGNPGNDEAFGHGAVDYEYRIMAHEVTNEQYAVFLNWKATVGDAIELYNPGMTSDPRGGIDRTGSGTVEDPWVYTPKPNMANKPVVYVDVFDAMRMANWIQNGQGDGDTEFAGYPLLGGTPVPTNGFAVLRNGQARYWLPDVHEWHKAAFYEPGSGGNDYWLHASRSDAVPAIAQADAEGNISPPGPNRANYNRGCDWNGLDGNVTTVGSAGLFSRSPWGTYDQEGNVWEWNETRFGNLRGLAGGSWVEGFQVLGSSTTGGSATATIEVFSFGFRLGAASLPADLDDSGEVDLADLLVLLGQWGVCPVPPPDECLGDLDGDLAVGFSDLLLLLASWGG